jgi:hypothetical protein
VECNKVNVKNRFQGGNGSTCLLTVDGTDFRIQEPSPFWRGWYSHKFRGPGLRYEVALNIQNGWICWVKGPFAPGPWPDIKIFRGWLKGILEFGEMVKQIEAIVANFVLLAHYCVEAQRRKE